MSLNGQVIFSFIKKTAPLTEHLTTKLAMSETSIFEFLFTM